MAWFVGQNYFVAFGDLTEKIQASDRSESNPFNHMTTSNKKNFIYTYHHLNKFNQIIRMVKKKLISHRAQVQRCPCDHVETLSIREDVTKYAVILYLLCRQ